MEGTYFTVITDHHSLLWLHRLKDPIGRLARWSVRLQQFDFTILHRKGKYNVVPDALSRNPIDVSAIDQPKLDEFGEDPFNKRMLKNITENPNDFPQ